MGYGRFDPSTYAAYTTSSYAGKSQQQVFTSREVPDELNPKNFTVRESRDSTLNPTSNAIIVACDVTGSMGHLSDALVRKGIGTTFEEILDRAKANDGTMIPDPQMCVMAVGDVWSDRGPVQATQFETEGDVLAKQLETVWLEGNGGGNGGESYEVAWYFAARRTQTDCFEKRNKKGYLFTVGDEPIRPGGLTKDQIKKFFGDDEAADDLTTAQLLAMAEQKWNVFHIIIEEGGGRMYGDQVRTSWTDLLGERAIPLHDHTKLAEVIVSTIQVNEGADLKKVVASWSGDTSLVVQNSLSGLTPAGGSSSEEVVTF